MREKVSRRTFLQLTGGAGLSVTLAGCFGVGNNSPNTGSSSSTITIWDIRTGSEQQVVQNVASAFNSAHSDIHVVVDFFQNDPYKQKLPVAMGAHNPPDIFFGSGGGILKSYISDNEDYEHTPDLNADTAWKNNFLPAVMSAVTFNGHIYGVPNSGMQPVMFFYNKTIFDQYHLNPPQTWSELLSIITTLKQHNIIPIALAGGSKWPYLMYEEYLVDRYGGPGAFDAVLANQKGSWSPDAVIKANTAIQRLGSMGACGSNFASVIAGTNQDAALVYPGKAAMMLQGNWNFPVFLTNNPQFIQSGKLGWFPFPAVEGGTGDPTNVAGNPCNYYSISKASKSPQSCITYLKSAVLGPDDVKKLIA